MTGGMIGRRQVAVGAGERPWPGRLETRVTGMARTLNPVNAHAVYCVYRGPFGNSGRLHIHLSIIVTWRNALSGPEL